MTTDFKLNWEEAVLSLRARPEQQALVKACFYDDPLIEAARRYAASTEWSAVRPIIGSPQGRALDVGSGRGISAFALASDGWQVTALEPDASEVVGAGAIHQLALDAGIPIEVVQEWGESLPFESGTFDLVHCRQVLHHARDLNRLCVEVGRVLKPGGRFIATREHVVSRIEDIPAFQAAHALHGLYGGENAFTLDQYRHAISHAGILLTDLLNPLESDINLYPETKADVKERLARRLFLPFPFLLPDVFLRFVGGRNSTPGRLYTFVGLKPGAA